MNIFVRSSRDPRKMANPTRGRNPQVENHCSNLYQEVLCQKNLLERQLGINREHAKIAFADKECNRP